MNMDTPIVNIGGKRTLEYVVNCLNKFNRDAEELIIRSIGGNISKGITVAQILSDFFNISIKNTIMQKIEIKGFPISSLKIILKSNSSKQQIIFLMNHLNIKEKI